MANNQEKKTNNKPDKDVIAKVVKMAICECYGVIGTATIKNKKGQDEEGIIIQMNADSTFSLELYVVVARGIKLTESLRSFQKTVKFYIEKTFPKLCLNINVFAEDISSK